MKYKNNIKTAPDLVDVLRDYTGTEKHKEKVKELQDGNEFAGDTFDFSFGNDAFEEKLPTQRWNNIVINRTINNIDVFINGKFITSIVPTTRSLNSGDRITIGQEGLSGAICNIKYYKEPQSKTQIAANYNLFSVYNPPIV